MNVVVIGTSYVGLTIGISLAFLGIKVTCIDIDEAKIEALQNNNMPIYEPGMQELFELSRNQLTFTTDYEVVGCSEVVFICVGTPTLDDGNPNMIYVKKAADQIGNHLGNSFTVVVNKSTVPIGSGNWVESLIAETFEAKHGFKPKGILTVVSNPEFLREGSALHDMLYPDRIVIGTDHPMAYQVVYSLYQSIINQSFLPPPHLPRPDGFGTVPVVATDPASAELIKYSANAFLSLKISFINEIACLAEKVGADITQIAQGIGLDNRIGFKFLNAGIGWGGSCFGKDTAALLAFAKEYGLEMAIVEASRKTNYALRQKVVERLANELKLLKGKTIGLMGLTFKPFTDDLRDSPAIDIAYKLLQRGVRVVVHDPIAMERAKKEYGDLPIKYVGNPEDLFEDGAAVVLMTEWPLYQKIDWNNAASKMTNRFILDGRNFLPQQAIEEAGIKYIGVGR